MYGRKLKSMKEVLGIGNRKQSQQKGDFRVRKVNQSSKKKLVKVPSLTLINDTPPHPHPSPHPIITPSSTIHDQKQNKPGLSVIKSLKQIGSNKDLLPLQKQLVKNEKLGLTFQLKKLYTITKQGEKRMQELVKVRSMKQLITEVENK